MALPDHLFEFIIFEACNMAGIEVAYELRNKAAYIMASSAPVVSPGFTPIYAGSISCLLEEAADLQRFAENYFHYWNLMEGDKRSATISIIKTAGLSNLANLIRQINTEISGSFLPVGNLQNYDGVLKAPFYFFDFAQCYQSLSDENTYNALQECISQCVVYKRNTPFYATEAGTRTTTKHKFQINIWKVLLGILGVAALVVIAFLIWRFADNFYIIRHKYFSKSRPDKRYKTIKRNYRSKRRRRRRRK